MIVPENLPQQKKCYYCSRPTSTVYIDLIVTRNKTRMQTWSTKPPTEKPVSIQIQNLAPVSCDIICQIETVVGLPKGSFFIFAAMKQLTTENVGQLTIWTNPTTSINNAGSRTCIFVYITRPTGNVASITYATDDHHHGFQLIGTGTQNIF